MTNSGKLRARVDKLSPRIVLIIGLLGSVLISIALHLHNKLIVAEYTNSIAEQIEAVIHERFSSYEDGLRGARGVIIGAGNDGISRKAFEQYIESRDLQREFPGSLGFGFIKRVSIEQESEFLQQASKDDAPDFSIKTLTPHNSDRFIIQYIYPIEPNRQAQGLDIGSEINRRNAALTSARHGHPYLTQPITLVQADSKDRRGVLMLLPVYRTASALDSPEQREASVIGWTYTPLIIDDVLKALSINFKHTEVVLNNTFENRPFYRMPVSNNDFHPEFRVKRIINVMGQQWQLIITPTKKSYQHLLWNITLVLICGVGVTLAALFSIGLLRSNVPQNIGSQYQEVSKKSGFTQFFFDKSTISSWLTQIFLMIVLLTLISWFIISQEVKKVDSQLIEASTKVTSYLKSQADHLQRDVRFLAKTPPVKALAALSGPGTDYEAMQVWRVRLAAIFKAYMLTVPEIYQVRLISAFPEWSETVKVQRYETGLQSLPLTQLQSKRNEPYIKQTIAVSQGSVISSKITLNKEYGEIEYPKKPMWRFSTPVYDNEGNIFGIIVVNILADMVFKNSTRNVPPLIKTFITNVDDEFIYYPGSSDTFAFESGRSFKWNEQYMATGLSLLETKNMFSYKGEDGLSWQYRTTFSDGTNGDKSQLNIYSSINKSKTLLDILIKIAIAIIALLLIYIFIVLTQYWILMTSEIKNKDAVREAEQRQKNKEIFRFKALLNSSPEATLVVNKYGIIKIANEQAEKLFQYSKQSLEGLSVNELIPHDLRQNHDQYMSKFVNNPKDVKLSQRNDLFAIDANGKRFPVEISINSVNMDDGIFISVSIRDISARIENEKSLKNALESATAATEAKSNFLANTSHEIRTPLNAIIGLSHLLSSEPLSVYQQQLVKKIYLSGKNLLDIVNDVLDISKIEANEMHLSQMPLDLSKMLHELVEIFSVQAELKQIAFKSSISSQIPAWVKADEIRLLQILNNLLNNALKFTSEGEISLDVAVLSLTKAENMHPTIMLRFTVSDTGIGIAPDALASLFQPFSQADTSTTRKFGGTGLGLSIVQKLVSLMNGKVGVDSQEGAGSVFWVEVPVIVMTQHDPEVQALFAKMLHLLIVGESDTALKIKKIAVNFGWNVELIEDRDTSVTTLIDRFDKGNSVPDVILFECHDNNDCDSSMLSTLTDKIPQELLPVIAVFSDQETDLIIANDSDFLIKFVLSAPITPSELFNSVNQSISEKTGNMNKVIQSTCTDITEINWLSNLNILVVDDHPMNLEVAEYVLKQAGAIVDTATDAKQAVDKLKVKIDYDAVLMDVQMPKMDGLQATQIIRDDLGLTELPIIALTAGAFVEERQRALSAGMNDYLTKPISPSKLIKVLRMHICKSNGEYFPVKDCNQSKQVEFSCADDNSWPEIKGLNGAQSNEIFMGNQQLLFSTLDQLINENRNLLRCEQLDFDKPDAYELRLQLSTQIHKLRSSSGMIGAERLFKLSSRVEPLLRDPHASVNSIMYELGRELGLLVKASERQIEYWKERSHIKQSSSAQEQVDLTQPETLHTMIRQLAEHDLGVLELVEQYQHALHKLMGESNFQSLKDALMQLNFESAKHLVVAAEMSIGKAK